MAPHLLTITVSSQLQQGFSVGIAAVGHDPHLPGTRPLRRLACVVRDGKHGTPMSGWQQSSRRPESEVWRSRTWPRADESRDGLGGQPRAGGQDEQVRGLLQLAGAPVDNHCQLTAAVGVLHRDCSCRLPAHPATACGPAWSAATRLASSAPLISDGIKISFGMIPARV